MKVYRAADENWGGEGTCWAEREEDARSYLDNPGYGGHTLYEGDLPNDFKILNFDMNDYKSDDQEAWDEAIWGWILDDLKIKGDVPPPWTRSFDDEINRLRNEYDILGEYAYINVHKLERAKQMMENPEEEVLPNLRGYPYSILEEGLRSTIALRKHGYQAVRYYDDFPRSCITIAIIDDEVENVKEIDHSQAQWQTKRKLEKEKRLGSRGWHYESSRHALAARGIRTR